MIQVLFKTVSSRRIVQGFCLLFRNTFQGKLFNGCLRNTSLILFFNHHETALSNNRQDIRLLNKMINRMQKMKKKKSIEIEIEIC